MDKNSTSQVSEDIIIFPQTTPLSSSNSSSCFGWWPPLIFLLFYLLFVYLISRYFSYLYRNRLLPSWFYD